MPLTAGLDILGLRPGVCTSTTRPASPYDGQVIYETDTDRIMCYNGTSWIAEITAGTIDAKGDLLVGTADNTVGRQAVGTNDRVLMAASGETTGVKWGGTYTDVSSTQTFTGFTKGNATVTSKYLRIGDFVHFWGGVVLGSTSSMAGPLDIGLPFTAEQGIFFHPNAALYYDTSPGTVYWAVSINIGTTALRIPGIITSGTTATNYDVGAATPFTWANGDSFFWNHFFKVA